MMKMPTLLPTQSPKNVCSASSEKATATPAKRKVRSKKNNLKKAFTPKQYPKPTLAELAILVGNKKQNPREQSVIEKPLPYQLKWVEQGVEISIYAENKAFISSQMLRLQTHKVQPMKALLTHTKTERHKPIELPEPLQEETTAPAFATINKIADNESVESSHLAQPTRAESFSVEQQSITQPINPSEAWLNTASTSELSALLGLLENDYSVNQLTEVLETEEVYPADIELEFQTPIEAKIADYLGVNYSSKTTISVAESEGFGTNKAPSSLPDDALLLPIDAYFSEELEVDLDQQKAWLASALEREKQKAYPLPKVELTPLVPVELEAPPPDVILIEAIGNTLAVPEVAEDEEEVICYLPLSQITIEETQAIEPSETLGAQVIPENNDQAFAAVLDSLMEDFSCNSDKQSAIEDGIIVEPTEETTLALPAEIVAVEPFEVVGIFAEQMTVPTLTEEEETLDTDDELNQPAAVEETDSDNPFDEITSFSQLLKATAPDTPMDFLLLGTFFLKQTEQTNAFSLRQLNQLLSSVSKPNANHTVLELALSNHFITMIPDLTGLATATQYQLSKRGEASALRLFEAITL
jgi:hypothetical protein